MINLSKLIEVQDLRTVWPHEALDFTPWLGLIRTKLEETTLTSIALSVFVTNLFKIQARILSALILLIQISWNGSADFQAETI